MPSADAAAAAAPPSARWQALGLRPPPQRDQYVPAASNRLIGASMVACVALFWGGTMGLLFCTDSLSLQYYGALIPLVLPPGLLWVYFNWLGISFFLGN